MNMKLIFKLLFPAVVMLSPGLQAEDVFNADKANDGIVYLRDKIIINSDGIGFPDFKAFSNFATEKSSAANKAGWKINNLWSSAKEMPFRREIAVSPDGKELELSFQIMLPAYAKGNDSSLSYSFNIPLETLANMKWTAISGKVLKNEINNGVLSNSTPDGNFIGSSVRWLAFENGDRKIVFDFNPEGVASASDYGPTVIQGLWSVRKDGKFIKCGLGRKPGISGEILNSKVIIFEGKYEDYEKRHANKTCSEVSDMPEISLFSFGSPKTGKMYQAAGTKAYSAKDGFGWLSGNDLKIETAAPSGALYSAVTGINDAAFKCMLEKPGLYLVTFRAAAFAEPSEKFSVGCNGMRIAEDLVMDKNSVKTVTWPQWIENGGATVELKGNWHISTLGFQLLQTTAEDFKFRRGFWLAEDMFEPSVMYKSRDYQKQPDFKVAIDEISLPSQKDIANAKPLVMKYEICLPDAKDTSLDWRYHAVIGSLGPSNWGNFTEYATAELAERRFSELKKENVNAVIVNGFLSRHTFPSHLDRVEENIKLLTQEAHKKDITLVDHQDLTLLWNLDSGFRVLTGHTDWLQRTVDTGLPTRGLCPVNKLFKEHYFKWITGFIKNTGIDGIMIDEVFFHGPTFCGCKDCRETFHRETGLVLPLDETSPELFNKDSVVWRTWLSWRKKAVGDWWVELRQQINKFKPDFTMLCYTTHYGYCSDFASINFGAGVTNVARACNFLGTEIMSRNVMASCRAIYAFRKAKNALRETYGTPVFGLVYPMDDWDLAYFGWAMNNMNGQITWLVTNLVKPAGKSDFINFPLNMDMKNARPVSNTALLFSEQSRDWQKDMGFAGEIIGTSETLTDNHFQHSFIFDEELKPEKLKQYKSVLINSASCLGDKQIEALRDYVRNGGNVYLSGHAGLADEMGTYRKEWPFKDVFGIAIPVPVKILKTSELVTADKENIKTLSPVNYLPTQVSDKNKSIQFLFAKSNNHQEAPIGFEANYGKGKFFYCSAQLGGNLYEPETTINKKWSFVKDEKLAKLYMSILQQATGKDPFITPANIPESVFVSVYAQPGKDGGIITMVHLLNGSGVVNKKDEDVRTKAFNPAWPELKEDLIFNLPLASISEAYAASPDFSGPKSVPYKKLENGQYQITVPKDILKSYSIIYLKL